MLTPTPSILDPAIRGRRAWVMAYRGDRCREIPTYVSISVDRYQQRRSSGPQYEKQVGVLCGDLRVRLALRGPRLTLLNGNEWPIYHSSGIEIDEEELFAAGGGVSVRVWPGIDLRWRRRR